MKLGRLGDGANLCYDPPPTTAMIWAIFSDIHGRVDRLRWVQADAAARGAGGYLFLGDAGGDHVLRVLAATSTVCVFGNWEASGLRGLEAPWRGSVARWQPRHQQDGFWAAHASPVWPAGLGISGVVDYLRVHDLHWSALFPSLQRSETARWAALTELEAANVPLFLHGHTHVQEAWLWHPGATPERLSGPQFDVPQDGSRLLVGVGSVGEPHDGDGACYALDDETARQFTWQRVAESAGGQRPYDAARRTANRQSEVLWTSPSRP